MDELGIKEKNKTVVKNSFAVSKPSKRRQTLNLIWGYAPGNEQQTLYLAHVISSLEGCWYRLGKPTCSDPFRLLLMKTCTSRWRCVVYDYTDEI